MPYAIAYVTIDPTHKNNLAITLENFKCNSITTVNFLDSSYSLEDATRKRWQSTERKGMYPVLVQYEKKNNDLVTISIIDDKFQDFSPKNKQFTLPEASFNEEKRKAMLQEEYKQQEQQPSTPVQPINNQPSQARSQKVPNQQTTSHTNETLFKDLPEFKDLKKALQNLADAYYNSKEVNKYDPQSISKRTIEYSLKNGLNDYSNTPVNKDNLSKLELDVTKVLNDFKKESPQKNPSIDSLFFKAINAFTSFCSKARNCISSMINQDSSYIIKNQLIDLRQKTTEITEISDTFKPKPK